MPFIYKQTDIRDKRVKNFVDTLHKSFTRLMLLNKQAEDLIDVVVEQAYIASLSQNDGDTSPVLPLGDELVFQFNSLGFNFLSDTKFIVEEHSGQTLLDVLELDYAEESEVLPEGTTQLSNGLKIRDGAIIFKNLELYDYDYQSYEVLNEMYNALEVFFTSIEAFYAKFYYDQTEGTLQTVLVYDTEDIDAELNDVIFPIADTITDVDNRALVKSKYEELRDTIKFFCMDIALQLDEEITRLLFCINGSKKYTVIQNIETKQLEMIVDDNGYQRRIHKEEEVFFPFHNKPTLSQFTEGLRGKF